MSALTTFDSLLKDMYPLPGTLLKQWVVDQRREAAWERETCPRLTPAEHDDNTGIACRNSMCSVPWTHLAHDCCYFCNDLGARYEQTPEVQAWLAEKAKRPPIEQDLTKFSNEIERTVSVPNPWFAMLPKERK